MPPNEICLCGHKRHLHAPERGAASNLEGVGACSMIGYNPSTHESMSCGCRFFRMTETINVAIAGTGDGRLIVDDPRTSAPVVTDEQAAKAAAWFATSMVPSVAMPSFTMTDAQIVRAASLLRRIDESRANIRSIEERIAADREVIDGCEGDIAKWKAEIDTLRRGEDPDLPF